MFAVQVSSIDNSFCGCVFILVVYCGELTNEVSSIWIDVFIDACLLTIIYVHI